MIHENFVAQPRQFRYHTIGEPDRIPESVEAARGEISELIVGIQEVEAALGTAKANGDTDSVWRRRAVDARRHMNERNRFLKGWLKDQRQTEAPLRALKTVKVDLSDVFTTTLIREAAKRTGYLESVYVASVALLQADTPKNRSEWESRVKNAVSAMTG